MAFYQGFCGARWNRTTDLSIISAGQRAGQAIGIPSDLPFRATTSHQKTARATSFGHALGTAEVDTEPLVGCGPDFDGPAKGPASEGMCSQASWRDLNCTGVSFARAGGSPVQGNSGLEGPVTNLAELDLPRENWVSLKPTMPSKNLAPGTPPRRPTTRRRWKSATPSPEHGAGDVDLATGGLTGAEKTGRHQSGTLLKAIRPPENCAWPNVTSPPVN